MPPKVVIQGKLRFSGGRLLLPIGKGKGPRTVWGPKIRFDGDSEQLFLELQRREPQLFLPDFWVYKDYVLRVEVEPDKERAILIIKQFILRRERDYYQMKLEVESLQNLGNSGESSREPIPEAVRIFVWKRDGGKCVKCGRKESLEFDHIIPVSKGGSNTERNIQLLCEPCNRTKGSTI